MTPAVAICDVSVEFASDRYHASSATSYWTPTVTVHTCKPFPEDLHHAMRRHRV